jgi:hypothetical protein
VRPLDRKAARDIRTLVLFIRVYCRARHGNRPTRRVPGRGVLAPYVTPLEADLCDECGGTLLHGAAKRVLCPYDPKPRCKHCPTPCYAPGHREKVREIMRYSGMRLLLRGRVDLLFKYFL